MSGITKKQARLLRNQIKKIYGRSYIPNLTGSNTISIGDILFDSHDETAAIDSTVFADNLVRYVEGSLIDRNITSNSEVTISTKFKGQNILPGQFNVNEAGIVVGFSSENQMFLKIKGARQRSMTNFIDFRKYILERYTQGDISSKVYIVRGLIYADKYYLQYSGKNGGTIGFNLDAEISGTDADVKADFSFKWKKDVSYGIDANNGGVLGYRISAVRLKRHLIPEEFQVKILNGLKEEDVLNNISFSRKKELFDNDILELVDVTDELILLNRLA